MRRCTLLSLIICLTLVACGEESAPVVVVPREPDSHSVGYYCLMTLTEHPGPKGQLLLKNAEKPLWFSSVRDALTYVEQDLPNEDMIAGFWVNDMAQGTWDKPAPGSWVDATKAWYALESHKRAATGGGEAVPFKERADAEAFAKEFGGYVGDYSAARRQIARALTGEGESGGTL